MIGDFKNLFVLPKMALLPKPTFFIFKRIFSCFIFWY